SMPDRAYQLVLARIAPTADAQGNLPVEAELPNDDRMLTAGTPATLRITVATHAAAVTVPVTALVTRGGVQAVMVAQGGYAHLREVVVGVHVGERVELVSGVRAGEDVIVSPGSLADGAAITQ